jgi:ABC-type transporter MlaC component
VAAADPEPAPVQRVEPPTRSNKFAASPPAPAASAGASQDSAMVTLARMLLSKKPERSEADLLRLARDAMDEFAADARRIAAEPNVNLADRVGEFKNLLGYVVDFPMMGKLVVGSYRSTMTIDQWEDFIRLYKSLLLSGDYSFSSVEQWDGSVDIEGLHRDGQDFVANFSITSSKGATLKLGFRVRKSDTGGLPYKVIDVKASGVSLIRTQRSEFQSILKSQGVDGLNRILSNKLEQRKTRG